MKSSGEREVDEHGASRILGTARQGWGDREIGGRAGDRLGLRRWRTLAMDDGAMTGRVEEGDWVAGSQAGKE